MVKYDRHNRSSSNNKLTKFNIVSDINDYSTSTLYGTHTYILLYKVQTTHSNGGHLPGEITQSAFIGMNLPISVSLTDWCMHSYGFSGDFLFSAVV